MLLYFKRKDYDRPLLCIMPCENYIHVITPLPALMLPSQLQCFMILFLFHRKRASLLILSLEILIGSLRYQLTLRGLDGWLKI